MPAHIVIERTKQLIDWQKNNPKFTCPFLGGAGKGKKK